MPQVLTDGRSACQIRQIAQDAIWDADILGEITSWSSASHPLTPTQIELDNAETAIDSDPSLCDVGEIYITNSSGDSLVEVNSSGVLLLEGTPLSGLGDNLGDHTATQDLDLAGFNIINADDIISLSDLTLTDGTRSILINSDGLSLVFDAADDLRINGAAGTAGQIITSQGVGLPPTWDFYSYNDLEDVPTTFPPAPHTHVLADITDLNSTDDLPEGVTNLYYTDARVAASPAVSTNTSDIAALQLLSHDPATAGNDGITITGQAVSLNLDTLTAGNIAVITAAEGLYVPPPPVDSVNGQTGAVVLDTDDVSEGVTNLYYTDTRVDDSPAVNALQAVSHDPATALDTSLTITAAQVANVNISTDIGNSIVLTPTGLFSLASSGGALGITRILLAGQADTNDSLAGVPVQFGSIDPNINTIAGLSLDTVNNEITLPEGLYEAVLDVSFGSAAARSNVGARLLIAGVNTSEKYFGAYIRNNAGHNEAGGVFNEAFTIGVGGQVISYEFYRLAAAGVVNTLATLSRLLIKKIS